MLSRVGVYTGRYGRLRTSLSGRLATMEYTLNVVNTVSLNVVPAANGLADGLARAVGHLTGSATHFVTDAWPTAGNSGGVPAVYAAIGAGIFVVGYLFMRRA